MFISLVLIVMLLALFAALLYAALTLRPLHQEMQGEPLAIIPVAREATTLDLAYTLDSSALTWHIREAHELGFWQQARTLQDALGAVMLRERLERENQAVLAERQTVRPIVRLHVPSVGLGT